MVQLWQSLETLCASENKKRRRKNNMDSGYKGKVCVTGAAGYLASWLIKRLLLSGYHVVGTVRDPGPCTSSTNHH